METLIKNKFFGKTRNKIENEIEILTVLHENKTMASSDIFFHLKKFTLFCFDVKADFKSISEFIEANSKKSSEKSSSNCSSNFQIANSKMYRKSMKRPNRSV